MKKKKNYFPPSFFEWAPGISRISEHPRQHIPNFHIHSHRRRRHSTHPAAPIQLGRQKPRAVAGANFAEAITRRACWGCWEKVSTQRILAAMSVKSRGHSRKKKPESGGSCAPRGRRAWFELISPRRSSCRSFRFGIQFNQGTLGLAPGGSSFLLRWFTGRIILLLRFSLIQGNRRVYNFNGHEYRTLDRITFLWAIILRLRAIINILSRDSHFITEKLALLFLYVAYSKIYSRWIDERYLIAVLVCVYS